MIKCGTSMKKKSVRTPVNTEDYLEFFLKNAPSCWALVRANEMRIVDQIRFQKPILDVGCGDGIVANAILNNRNYKFDYGIDLSQREVNKAVTSGCYNHCQVASVYQLPFKNNYFKTVFSNSVVEHLKNLDLALFEMSRVLSKNGSLIITVPASYITDYLIGTTLLNKFHIKFLADSYGHFFNRLYKHYNLYNHKEWKKILGKHSLVLTEYKYYHTPTMIKIHEFLSYLSLPFHLLKPLTGRWTFLPLLRNKLLLPLFCNVLNSYISDVDKNEGGAILLIAQKK